MSDCRVMPSPQFIAGAFVVVAVVLAAFGAVQTGSCNGGTSLAYFGIAAILIGASIALLGGVGVLPPIAIIGLILVGVGWYQSNAAGCTLF